MSLNLLDSRQRNPRRPQHREYRKPLQRPTRVGKEEPRTHQEARETNCPSAPRPTIYPRTMDLQSREAIKGDESVRR